MFLSANDAIGQKTIYFVDTFEGLPAVSEEDVFWKKGDMGGVSLDRVQTSSRAI